MTYQIWIRRHRKASWNLYWAGDDSVRYEVHCHTLDLARVEHKCAYDGRWVKYAVGVEMFGASA